MFDSMLDVGPHSRKSCLLRDSLVQQHAGLVLPYDNVSLPFC